MLNYRRGHIYIYIIYMYVYNTHIYVYIYIYTCIYIYIKALYEIAPHLLGPQFMMSPKTAPGFRFGGI